MNGADYGRFERGVLPGLVSLCGCGLVVLGLDLPLGVRGEGLDWSFVIGSQTGEKGLALNEFSGVELVLSPNDGVRGCYALCPRDTCEKLEHAEQEYRGGRGEQ